MEIKKVCDNFIEFHFTKEFAISRFTRQPLHEYVRVKSFAFCNISLMATLNEDIPETW